MKGNPDAIAANPKVARKLVADFGYGAFLVYALSLEQCAASAQLLLH